jgi:hypothetical protein
MSSTCNSSSTSRNMQPKQQWRQQHKHMCMKML